MNYWVCSGLSLKRSRWSTVFTVIGIIIFAAYLAYTNPFTVLTEAGRFNAWIFTGAVLLNWVGLVFMAASWHVLLNILGVKASLWASVKRTFISMFVVWMFPVPSGVEIIRAYLVKDEEGSNMGKAVSSVIVSKVYYFISFGVLITLAAVVVTFIQEGGIPVRPELVWFVVLYALANSVLFGVILTPRLLSYVYDASPGWARRYIFDRVYTPELGSGGFPEFIDEIHKAVTVMQESPLENLLSLLLIGFHWSTGAITAYLVSYSLGHPIDFWVLVLIYAVIEFIQQLNILIPSGLGVVDAGLTGAFVVIGVPLSLASAISLLTRLATYWFELVLCGAVSLVYGYREAVDGAFS
ncbi:MAG: flippase-like domain-containing protein [Candidatus Bathyarchaeota archaeon]|nr:flippase-like domain-containing protein [Candidatus Bathyarchaeota archaeon]